MPTSAVIKIGTVVATSGPVALLGKSFLKAIQLAAEELKDTTHHYELLVEEIASPDKAEPAIEKLITIDRVDAVVVGLSMSGEIVKPYATAAKIPLFCICSVGSVGDELYTFTTMPLAEDEATLWVAEANQRGIKRVALLTQGYPSIDNHVRALRAEATNVGIVVVYADRFAAARRTSRLGSRPRRQPLPTCTLSRRSTRRWIWLASSSGTRVSGTWPRLWHSPPASGRKCSRAAGIPTAMSVLRSRRGWIGGIRQPGWPRT
jgi:Periplasmic binding protein